MFNLPNDWKDPKVVVALISSAIALYAAVVSSINLIWMISNSINDRIRSVFIRVSFMNVFTQHQIFGVSNVYPQINIALINKKKIDVTIERKPTIEFKRKVYYQGNKYKSFQFVKRDDRFPITLEYGKIFEFVVDSNEMSQLFANRIDKFGQKARIVVIDSFGKRYVTKYYKREIIKCIEIATMVNT